MAEPWLDSLSEDWEAEERSSPPASLPRGTPHASVRRSAQESPTNSIKRTKHGNSSPSPSKRSANGSSPSRSPISTQRSGNGIHNSAHSSTRRSHRSDEAFAHSTLSSNGSVVHFDTVARKSHSSSPPKSRKLHDPSTPEWKRLIMNGHNGLAIQQDLFSPIGLEGIFERPEESGDGTISKKIPKLSFMKNYDDPPSSPPLWPKTKKNGTVKTASVRFAEFPTIREAPEPFSEQDEEEEDDYLNQEHSEVQSTENEDSSQALPNEIEQPSIDETATDEYDSYVTDRDQQERELDETENQDQHPVGTVRSRMSQVTSATSGFSPVLISKHNTADGKVDYTPYDKSHHSSLATRAELNHDESVFDDQTDNPMTAEKSQADPIGPSHLFRSGNRFDSSLLDSKGFSPSADTSIAPSDSISHIFVFGQPEVAPQPLVTSTTAQIARSNGATPALDAQVTPETPTRSSPQKAVLNGAQKAGSPLKLFGNNDTWTNGRLMSRMEQLRNGDDGTQKSRSSPNSGSPTRRTRKSQFNFVPPDNVDTSPGFADKAATGGDSEQKSAQIVPRPMTPESPNVADMFQTKRGLSTPSSKHPTPKRQRTLFPFEAAQAAQGVIDVVEDQHRRLQATAEEVSGQANSSEVDFAVQDGSVASPSPVRYTHEGELVSELEQLSLLQSRIEEAEIDPVADDVGTVKAVATEVAKIKLKAIANLKASARQPSVSTQDYLDEALKIMDIIRSSRPVAQSELSNLEEADTLAHEEQTGGADNAPQDVTRPPSREGVTNAWRSHNDTQLDPRVVSRLQKYAENGDDTFAMSSMMRSMRISQQQQSEDMADQSVQALETDMPNIRITGPRASSGYRVSSLEHKVENQESLPRKDSIGSADSINKSVGTNSTGRTKTVPMISPGKVSHLISSIEEAAGMRYDRERQAWIKDRTKRHRANSGICSSSTGTEDPFEQIPDLSTHDGSAHLETGPARVHSEEAIDVQQTSRTSSDSGPSLSQFPLPGQRIPAITSKTLGREPTVEVHPERKPSQPLGLTILQEESELVDEDLPQSEGHLEELAETDEADDMEDVENVPPTPERIAKLPNGSVRSKRQTSSALSSPLTSDIWAPESAKKRHPGDAGIHALPKTSTVIQTRQAQQNDLRRQALRNVSNVQMNRFMSFADTNEHREISLVERRPDGRTLSMTLSVATPLAKQRPSTAGPLVNHINDTSGILQSLSPLSDFSIHQDNGHHLDKRNLVNHTHTDANHHLPLQPPVVVSRLVEKLTDVEPEEPYWDSMRALDLTEKHLSDLHMLDHFCPGVEELNISNNKLQQLGGVPLSVRQLSVRNNCLSSLTTWAHLSHLQYLDLSGNSLESLEGLGDLLHLRDLKVDNNLLTSLEGVFDLDSLLTLSAKGNKMIEVDFQSADMKRLTKLDLNGNSLKTVDGLHCLPALTELDLGHNQLDAFLTTGPHLQELQILRVAHNHLEFLDISRLPRLSHLDVDSNNLARMPLLPPRHALSTLSIRNQSIAGLFELSFEQLGQFADIEHLYLSGTSLASFPIATCFLNLRTLELALTGLQSLPRDFGVLAPNIRDLNLNMNSIKDLKPLRGIAKLNHLHLAGNRLSRLRKALDIVHGLAVSGHLKTLDVRDNPVSVGFYSSLQASSANGHELAPSNNMSDQGNLAPVASTQTMRYLLPKADEKLDGLYEARLEEDTRLRRRVFELLLATKCPGLEMVDGLPWQERKQKALGKDEIWSKLKEMGVVADKDR